MNLQKYLINQAKEKTNTIVLPEALEPRIINATAQIIDQNIADIILLGNENEILKKANKQQVNIEKATIIDPEKSDLINDFTQQFFDMRQHKGITKNEAQKKVKDPLYFGTMLVHNDKAQGMVAGSINRTSDVLRPSFQIIKTKENISIVSGAFIMDVPNVNMGSDGIFVFADGGVNPNPDSQQLAEIAISSAETARNLLKIDPIVALLSFSTKGSAQHELVSKVQKATEIAQQKAPDLKIDGELQADAALVPGVGSQKAPDSKIAGQANVLIFPDLQSGNIGYKLVQRLAKAEAYGPILQGIAKPVNDLSRGCSIEDIVNVVAITCLQSQN